MIRLGDIFGNLTVIDKNIMGYPKEQIQVSCDCGIIKTIRVDSLTSGRSKSCGCKAGFQKKHGLSTRKEKHPHYLLWCRIRQRCFDKRYIEYAYYGGRGITVSKIFSDPEVFIGYLKDTLGPQPTGTSLGRIDNDKGYIPGNLKWETATEQNRNRRNTVRYDYKGENLTVSEIAEKAGVDSEKLNNRVKLRRSRGYTFDIHDMVAKLKFE